jgi:hypothetical protein
LGLSNETLTQRMSLAKVGTEGVIIHRKQVLLKGDSPAVLANQLLDLLLQENVITEGGA